MKKDKAFENFLSGDTGYVPRSISILADFDHVPNIKNFTKMVYTVLPPDKERGIRARKHFGKNLDHVLRECEPLVTELERVVGGVRNWFIITDLGNHTPFIKAMLTWAKIRRQR